MEIEPEGGALQQIKDKGYADKYRGLGQPIHLIGVEFSREQRRVAGFEVQSIEAR
ncbi:MAG: PD-(D/E)XK nuclease domain-containing protein [Azoarcus sp.]|nr:PD-(D/E)XK nuclease domain-containing protein [Azoarcus sp.]